MLIFALFKRETDVDVDTFWKTPLTTREFWVELTWAFGEATHPLKLSS